MSKEMNLDWLPEELRPFVKCKVTPVQIDDSPKFEVRTYTVRPCSASGQVKKFGPDDQTYVCYPELVNLVPRGFSELWVQKQHHLYSHNEEHMYARLQGPPKFDGTSAIDDDDADLSLESQYGILDEKKLHKWEETKVLEVDWQEKANGKFAIFMLLDLENVSKGGYYTHKDTFIFGGSKNVHVLAKLGSEVGKFKIGEESQELHYEILRAIVNDLNKLSEDEIENLINKKTVVVGEYVDGKHLVYTEKPYMTYFSVPDEVNLPRVKKVLPTQNYLPTAEQLRSIRSMKNVEGVVICYRNTVTGEILRQKHKSVWYILLRCWREILSKKDNTTDTNFLTKSLQRRTHERSKQFLNLTDEELKEYDELAESFMKWLSLSKYLYKDVSPFSNVGMASIFHEYQQDPTAVFELKENLSPPTPDQILSDPSQYHQILQLAKAGFKVCVILRGLPGCGKTTLAKLLERDLTEAKITVSRHCTDKFFMIDGKYVFDPKLLKDHHDSNLREFQASDAQVKINENTNTVKWEYEKYCEFARYQDSICMVLDCRTAPIKELAVRNTHSVPEDAIRRMANRFKPSIPMYYGVFVDRKDIVNHEVKQRAPLHITCSFIGGEKKLLDEAEKHRGILGQTVDITVKGISVNPAGVALVVECPIPTENAPHITLITNDGFSPVNVGKNINAENTQVVQSYVVKGVLACMY